jgi:hypothetical protein
MAEWLGYREVPEGGFPWHDEYVAKMRSSGQDVVDVGVGRDLAPSNEDQMAAMEAVAGWFLSNTYVRAGGAWVMGISWGGQTRRAYVVLHPVTHRVEVGTRSDLARLGPGWATVCDLLGGMAGLSLPQE